MKKIILVSVVMLMALAGKAQHRVDTPHPDLKVEVKRAVVSNGIAVIDLLITNFGAEEVICFRSENGNDCLSLAYDDEGNQYCMLLGTPNKALTDYKIDVAFPPNIPLKFRLQINKLDSLASKFSLIKIVADSRGPMGLKWEKPITIHNLELTKQ